MRRERTRGGRRGARAPGGEPLTAVSAHHPPHPPQGRNKARLEPGYRTPIIAQVAWVRGTAVGWRERDLLGDI